MRPKFLNTKYDEAEYYEFDPNADFSEHIGFEIVHTEGGITMTRSEYEKTVPPLIKLKDWVSRSYRYYAPWYYCPRKYRSFLWKHANAPDLKTCVQRALRGFGYSDYWNANSYIAGVIVGTLTDLNRHNMGTPTVIYDENGKELHVYEHEFSEPDKHAISNNREHSIMWHRVLLDIVQGFEAWEKMEDNWYREDSEDYDKLKRRYDRAFGLLQHNFPSLWD